MYGFLLAMMPVIAQQDIQPTFNVVGTTDRVEKCRIVVLDRGLTVKVLKDNQEITIKDLVGLRRYGQPLPPPPTDAQLITTAGDRIAGKLTGGDNQYLKFAPSGMSNKLFKTVKAEEEWKVPLSSTAVLWFAATPAETPSDPSQYDWLSGNRNRDVFRFSNGDIDRGTLVGLDENAHFNFRSDQGVARNLKMSELAAIGFNPALARRPKPKGAYSRIVLTDSSRLSVANPSIDAGIFRGETLFGVKVAIPVENILSLDVFQGKAVYLSDLVPKKVEQTGFLSIMWPWTADRNVQGKLLRVATNQGESTFDKGLGTHPRTALIYDIAGKYRHFEALIGFNSGVIGGPTSIRIFVDGKEQDVGELNLLRSGKAIPIRINTEGAKELTLITDFGPAGGVGADVNWCEARLVE